LNTSRNRKLYEWSTAQKRAYHRIKSGIVFHHGEILRFLTLGSIPEMERDTQSSFRVLKERIRRLTVRKLLDNGYITKRQVKRQYREKKLDDKLTFDYLKIKTSEGPNGVLHILFFGDFLPQAWLKENWHDITGGCNSAYIRATNKKTHNEDRLSRYCITQYCVSQKADDGKTSFLSYSWAPTWVYQGFVADWKDFRAIYEEDKAGLFEAWKKWLHCLNRKKSPCMVSIPLESFG